VCSEAGLTLTLYIYIYIYIYILIEWGAVYMMKSKGPRTEPWETPQEEEYKEDRLLSYLTRKDCDDR